MMVHDPTDIRTVAEWIVMAQHVVALTGAGISTESGIPDFRGPDGVWTKNPGAEAVSDIDHYLQDPVVRAKSWAIERTNVMQDALPNAGHEALAEMGELGFLDFVVTQNIDGLHQAAGFPEDSLVEIHGNNRETVCTSCQERRPIQETLVREEPDPRCLRCGGILKRGVVYFGEQLNHHDLKRSEWHAEQADVFLALGTKLEVYPAARLPDYALFNGCRFVVINAEPTSLDGRADAIFREPLGVVLPQLVAALREIREES